MLPLILIYYCTSCQGFFFFFLPIKTVRPMDLFALLCREGVKHLKNIHGQQSTSNTRFRSLCMCFRDSLNRKGQFLSISSSLISLCQVLLARTCGTCMQEMNYLSKSGIHGLDSLYCIVLNYIVLLPRILPSFRSSEQKLLEMS